MTDRPSFIFNQSPEQRSRPLFIFFQEAPKPVFAEAYNGIQRYVDIGEEHYRLILDEIVKLKAEKNIKVENMAGAGVTKTSVEFQRIYFGPQVTANKRQITGYLMIEPENLYDAIVRLNYLGKQRIASNRYMEYRWEKPFVQNDTMMRAKSLGGRMNEVLYSNTTDSSLIRIYANTQDELIEIFQELMGIKWDMIEANKAQICKTINIKKPQKGQTRFSFSGNEYLTLEY